MLKKGNKKTTNGRQNTVKKGQTDRQYKCKKKKGQKDNQWMPKHCRERIEQHEHHKNNGRNSGVT
jgi:hypothetical protein